ncbi:MAG TPA: DUF2130 domain-containing protein [Steroidobacteraceae bacterium]|nr:DUF2130 domain-containing protein [Steroidobacteraceae bacterium]
MNTSPRPVVPRDLRPHEPTIHCPHCQAEIKLTESLAAPLLEAKELEFKRMESELREREASLARQRHALEQEVAGRLAAERKKVAEEEQRKARLALGIELETKQRELADLSELLKSREAKLAEAQQAQAEMVRKQRELEEKERELDLTIERRVSANVSQIQQKARQEAEDLLKLKVAEKDQLIGSMQRQIEELRRKSEQGSQQLQGEAMEAELFQLLTTRFDDDTITRVQKGEFGGDVLHTVVSQSGLVCGTILWESKRTKHWSEGWLAKLRQDQRAAKAEIAVIVSHTLPKGVTQFDLVEGVYVVSPQCVVPVATLLRKALLELAIARQSSQGLETKAGLLYQYLTGPRFRQRVQAIVEAFTSMQDDLVAEKKALQKQWAKRETQLERLMNSTVGMYGDLQGIAGRSLEEIEGLTGLTMIEGPADEPACGT